MTLLNTRPMVEEPKHKNNANEGAKHKNDANDAAKH